MDSASLRRGGRGSKSGLPGGGGGAFEVGTCGGERAEVLGPVQLAGRVLLVAVESHGDRRAVIVGGELVVVVPAVAASLVRGAVGADAGEGDEVEVAGVDVFAHAEVLRRGRRARWCGWSRRRG